MINRSTADVPSATMPAATYIAIEKRNLRSEVRVAEAAPARICKVAAGISTARVSQAVRWADPPP
jgi:hypothetical protein